MHSSPLIAVPPCTPQAPNQAKLVAAIEVRDLEALREALADPEGISPALLEPYP